MNHNLFFSVVIPTYNRSAFILKSLDSVFQQDYTNFEIIVVNDGSTDNTLEVLSTITDSRLKIVSIHNSERAAARNRGVEIAKGDYVTFLDSDDKYYSNYLSNANTVLLKKNKPVFYHQAYEVRNTQGKILNYDTGYGNGIKFLLDGNPLSCLGVFIKREEALKYPFVEDRGLSGSEDWELWIRLSVHYGLAKDKTLTACLIAHDTRSVIQIEQDKLLTRKKLLLHYIFQDKKVHEIYGKYENRIISHSYTYIALHLILDGHPLEGIKFLLKAIALHPLCIIDMRMLGIGKHLLLSLFHIIFSRKK
ncbi:MAG: glycosyltransferase [Bacteroidetes bacterium]|nr:glycosyltransferase [Bacteroidota bacterium]